MQVLTLSAGTNNNIQKVMAIKGIRGLTGLGLREAKDIVDEVLESKSAKNFLVSSKLHVHEVDDYRLMVQKSNMLLSGTYNRDDPAIKGIIDKLNEVICFTNITGYYHISTSLVQVLENNFPGYKEEVNDA